jgi:hypothetical protein
LTVMNKTTSQEVTTSADTGTTEDNGEIIHFYSVTSTILQDNTCSIDNNNDSNSNSNSSNNNNNNNNEFNKPFVFIKRVTSAPSGQEIQSIAFTRGDRRARFLEWQQLYKDDEEVKLLKKLMNMYKFPCIQCTEDEKSSCNREEMNIENIDDIASSTISELESDHRKSIS